ncbi:MAG TPA: NrfD/PsrC family molybdoenzyme membrane anchor subunit [Solirubrobacteraceae bacterium]|jgi:formate-dependent nitrite reductase membrane component NrfD|nr:NrfD/PsrC family molybdoenzyme membrane anchor subunit [Solirubrobacteraceae bacterium]
MSGIEHKHGQAAASQAGQDRAGAGGDSRGRMSRADGGPQVPRARPTSYYGLPVLNGPVWTWEVPAYFFAGGMAGASAPLALAASLRGNDRLARAATVVALAGVAVSPPLLVADLGRPARFLNMLRMFKVRSPMSVGAWILSAFAPAVAAGAARELLGVLPAVGRAGQLGGAVLGPALSTYTGALLASTSVPAWHEARHELPFVFAGSSLASAGSAASLLAGAADAAPARRMAIGGALLSLAATATMERRLGALAVPYQEGSAAAPTRAAKALTATGALAMAAGSVAPRARGRLGGARARGRRGAQPRARGRLGGRWAPPRRGLGSGRGTPVPLRALQAGAAFALLAGAALERWAIFKAGTDSAADPAATIGPQRARADRAA